MRGGVRATAVEAAALEGVAVRAARAAGEVLRGRFGFMAGVPVEFKRSEVDLVTEVDRAAEAAALGVIRAAFPGHRIVSEETASASEGIWGPGHAWIVDPLDGTTNYVQGIPMFCVSVAVYRDGEPLLGLVYDPLREETFHARRGGGAFRNGEPVRVSAQDRLLRCLLATGTAVARFGEWPELLRDLAAVGPRAGNVRLLGTAALHLAYVACGRLDGFWERRLSPWDLAAGALLVAEAGGRVTRPDGAPFTLASHAILATNARIHGEMTTLLKSSTEVAAVTQRGTVGMSEEEVRALLRQTGVYREGHFLLTSGRHSPAFFLFSQAFQDPVAAERLGRGVAALFASEGVETVVGPAMGGVILAHEVARALGVRSLYAEKVDGGGMALKRGFGLRAGERVLVVEDAVTTGGSVQKVVDLVREAGAIPVGVGAVVDRSNGAAAFGIPFRALVRIEVPSYEAEACPLCRAGTAPVSPKAGA